MNKMLDKMGRYLSFMANQFAFKCTNEYCSKLRQCKILGFYTFVFDITAVY